MGDVKEGLMGLQIVVSVLLAGAILMQSRGSGLGRAWGGAGVQYHSKRGMEKLLFRATVVLSGLFFAVSIVQLVI
jgi:protein translocase SecG subunit